VWLSQIVKSFSPPSFLSSLAQKRELLYLSAQMIWHTTENGISVANCVLSLSLSFCFSLHFSWIGIVGFAVTTTLDNEIEPVTVNGLIAGIIIILGTGLGLGKIDGGEREIDYRLLVFAGVIIDANSRTLFSWSFATIFPLLLDWNREPSTIFFFLILDRIYNWDKR